jgi:transcription termination factor Rho
MTEDENKKPKKENHMTTEITDQKAMEPKKAPRAAKKTPAPASQAPASQAPASQAPASQAPESTPEIKPPKSILLSPPPIMRPMQKPVAPKVSEPVESDMQADLSSHEASMNKKNHKNRNNNQQRRKGQNFQHNHNRHRNDREPKESNYVEPSLPELPEGVEAVITKISDLQKMSFQELVKYAHSHGMLSLTNMNRSQIVSAIIKAKIHVPGQIIMAEGSLETLPDGFGFLRSPQYHYQSSCEDIYVSAAQILHYGLKKGDEVVGPIRMPKDNDKYFALLRVDKINNLKPSEMTNRKSFVNFTPIHPTERLFLETTKDNYSTRVIDLVSPVGKGQRALIVAPPKAGKTIILQNIINGIATNNPEVKLMVLLIDERPEEVTDMQRLIGNKGLVIASTFDEPPERHCVVAEMCIEKAKRLVEDGEHVVIILDSITRLARAYNTVQPHSGKILSGGVDANAMHKPKRFFGAARNLEEGGSLTIIGSALIDTGSKMDEVIYEEFKGTGNLELVLDRRLADRRLYPAIDVIKSGTRKEDLLYHKDELEKIYKLRAALADLSPADAMNLLLSRMKKTNANTEFLLSMKD